MLLENLRANLNVAVKTKNEMQKRVLRYVLGEISTADARGKKVDDELVKQTIKQVINKNREAINPKPPEGIVVKVPEHKVAEFQEEIQYLISLLPNLADKDKIRELSGAINEEVRNAKNAGQATGLVIKLLKQKNFDYFGDDVTSIIEELRA